MARSSARSRSATSATLITGILSVVIAARDRARPVAAPPVLGLAASSLVFFTFMTQMHERYAFAALIFLVLLLDERPTRWVWLVFGTVLMFDLFSAAPATAVMQQVLPISGPLGIVGSVVVTLSTLALVVIATRRTQPGRAAHITA